MRHILFHSRLPNNALVRSNNALVRCHFALERCYQHAITLLQMTHSRHHNYLICLHQELIPLSLCLSNDNGVYILKKCNVIKTRQKQTGMKIMLPTRRSTFEMALPGHHIKKMLLRLGVEFVCFKLQIKYVVNQLTNQPTNQLIKQPTN